VGEGDSAGGRARTVTSTPEPLALDTVVPRSEIRPPSLPPAPLSDRHAHAREAGCVTSRRRPSGPRRT
jgi:hypothetical protein